MSIFDNLELKQASEPTDEELLAEAEAWGFNTVEEWEAMMDEAYEEMEQEMYDEKLR